MISKFVPIGELFNLEKGELQSTKCTPGEYDFITAAEDWKTHHEYAHECEALIIAVAASGSLGRTHYVDGKFISSDLCFILTPKDEEKYPLNLSFYHFVFNSLRSVLVAATKSGTSKESINQTNLKKYELPYFDIEQQDLWIEKLKNTLIRKDLLVTELTHQQTLLKKLRQQILQEAIEGKLTKDWRAENSPPLEGCPKGGVVKYRNTQNYLKLPYNPKLKERARELRKAGNLSEVLFWNQIKRNQFHNLDFDRQKIIGNYIVDFYCANTQVVIEIDGSSHDDQQEYDAARDAYLEGLGLTVIHISDSDVKNNLDGLMVWLRGHEGLRQSFQELRQPPRQALPATPPEEGNWESASELLKRIQGEKQRLVADGKIKKQKPLPAISVDEKPFELPEGWVWCRLGDISINSLGKMLDAQKNKGELKQYLRNLNVQWFNVNTSDLKQMPFEEHETEKYSVKKGDIVICEGGYPGQAAIWDGSEYIMFQKALHRVRFISKCFPSTLFVHILWLWDANGEIKNYYTGAGIQHLTGKSLNKMIIPLPPLPEQKAIVTKVEKLLALCDQLEVQITSNQAHAKQLMQAVLKEAFSQEDNPAEQVPAYA